MWQSVNFCIWVLAAGAGARLCHAVNKLAGLPSDAQWEEDKAGLLATTV